MSHSTSSESSLSAIVQMARISKSFPVHRRLRHMIRHPFKWEWTQVLSDITLDVQTGEILGLVGPNGAGKSTLLRILAGLLLPSSGTALVCGHDVCREDQAVKSRVAYVPADERSFYGRLTGAQNLEYFARLQGLFGAHLRRTTAAVLERVGLADRADDPFMNYSSGMKQRLSIARGLLIGPQLVLLDEPTRSLDPVTARNTREFIADLCSYSGCAIIIASHNLAEIEALCDRVALLSHGGLVGVGTPAEISQLHLPMTATSYRLTVLGAEQPIRQLLDDAGIHTWSATPYDKQNSICIDLDGDAKGSVNSLIRSLLDMGCSIESLVPARATLEDAFLGMMDDTHANR